MSNHTIWTTRLLVFTGALLMAAWTCAAQDPTGLPQDTTAGAPQPPPAATPVTAPSPAPAPAPTPDATPAQAEKPTEGFRVGAFTFKPSGRVKLDVIRDFDKIG